MTRGKRIKNLREEVGLSQTALAEKIGVSKQTLYKYENDIVTNIPSDKIELIAKATGSTPEYIMGWDLSDNIRSDQATPDPKAEQLQALLATMSGEEKEELLNYIQFLLSKRPK
jgi:transcriptional regulator with XRE-family HTH domain